MSNLETKKTLPQLLDEFPIAERTKLSEQYSQWYNSLMQLYKTDFSIAENDDCKRNYKSQEEVVLFFRLALMWWYKNKPVITDVVSPLDAIKTWTCLGQIQALKNKLEETGIELSHLKLDEMLEGPKARAHKAKIDEDNDAAKFRAAEDRRKKK